MEQIIKAENLAIGYDKCPVAEHINFKINRGDYVCIIGENGAGKSTLVKTILGLIPPVGGSLEASDDISIGYLPQQTTLQKDFPATVKEIVMTGLLPGKKGFFYTKKDKETAMEKLSVMGIEDLAGKNFKNLSGGQQQKVLMARALCISGDAMLLDEPVTGLDPNATDDLYEMVKKLHKKGIAIIMVSHDRNAITRDSDHIMYIGDTFFYGTNKEFIASENSGFIRKGA